MDSGKTVACLSACVCSVVVDWSPPHRKASRASSGSLSTTPARMFATVSRHLWVSWNQYQPSASGFLAGAVSLCAATLQSIKSQIDLANRYYSGSYVYIPTRRSWLDSASIRTQRGPATDRSAEKKMKQTMMDAAKDAITAPEGQQSSRRPIRLNGRASGNERATSESG
jgi:hypothetical protein